MLVSLRRMIVFAQDVDRLAEFYCSNFGFAVSSRVPGEWAVVNSGSCELALHRAGAAFRYKAPRSGRNTNSKLVFFVDDFDRLRNRLISSGVEVEKVKLFSGFTGRVCDGQDPEGNVFQISEVAKY